MAANNYMLVRWYDPQDKVLNDLSKFEIVNENVANPSLIGLAPDLEYFAERIPYAYPESDPRLEIVQEIRTMTEDIETETGVRYYDLIYNPIQRTDDDKKNSVDDLMNQANSSVFPTKKQLLYLAMYTAIVDRKHSSQTITTEMQDVYDKVEAKITKMWQNYLLNLDKKTAIDLDQPPFLDDGWEDVDPEDEV
jgi:hypothetical protein